MGIYKIYSKDGNCENIELPTRLAICHECGGHGTISNPSIDGDGITGCELAELGSDFPGNYLAGNYDITCPTCKGRNVEHVVDADMTAPKLLEAYQESLVLVAQWDRDISTEY